MQEYFRILAAVIAAVDGDGHPVPRCIDRMFYDESGVYFLKLPENSASS